jgi:hypothetical protein
MQQQRLTSCIRTSGAALVDEIPNEMFGLKRENFIFQLEGNMERLDHGFKIYDYRNVCAGE